MLRKAARCCSIARHFVDCDRSNSIRGNLRSDLTVLGIIRFDSSRHRENSHRKARGEARSRLRQPLTYRYKSWGRCGVSPPPPRRHLQRPSLLLRPEVINHLYNLLSNVPLVGSVIYYFVDVRSRQSRHSTSSTYRSPYIV